MQILVVIANYGWKNSKYLQRLIKEYRNMNFHVKIIILSNVAKSFDKDIEVIVGLPDKNPWSLPFGYKNVFNKNIDKYDLFIYSEDDTLIQENNINAFIAATKELPKNKIAGFLRYEIYSDKSQYYTTIHSHFNWDPESIKKYGNNIYAHYSNEHSACFILTQEQMRYALGKNKFLKKPRSEKYDMLCTAATEPYTQIGLQKLICISRIDDFSLHHLPNVYEHKMGISRELLNQQIQRMIDMHNGRFSKGRLFNPNTKLYHHHWNKRFFSTQNKIINHFMPSKIRCALSIGTTCGINEISIFDKGTHITGVPVDSIIASCAEHHGIKTTSPDLRSAIKELNGRKFDCIVFCDSIAYFSYPNKTIKTFIKFLKPSGYLVILNQNYLNIKFLIKQFLKLYYVKDFFKLISFKSSGINISAVYVSPYLFKNLKINLISSNLFYKGTSKYNFFWFLYNVFMEKIVISIGSNKQT